MVSPLISVAKAGIEVERVAGRRDVGAHLGNGIAGIDDFDAQDVVEIVADRLRELAHQLGTLLGFERGPGRMRGFSRSDGAVDVGGARRRHVAETFFSGRIDRLEEFAAFTVDQITIDQHSAVRELGFYVHGAPPLESFRALMAQFAKGVRENHRRALGPRQFRLQARCKEDVSCRATPSMAGIQAARTRLKNSATLNSRSLAREAKRAVKSAISVKAVALRRAACSTDTISVDALAVYPAAV